MFPVLNVHLQALHLFLTAVLSSFLASSLPSMSANCSRITLNWSCTCGCFKSSVVFFYDFFYWWHFAFLHYLFFVFYYLCMQWHCLHFTKRYAELISSQSQVFCWSLQSKSPPHTVNDAHMAAAQDKLKRIKWNADSPLPLPILSWLGTQICDL